MISQLPIQIIDRLILLLSHFPAGTLAVARPLLVLVSFVDHSGLA